MNGNNKLSSSSSWFEFLLDTSLLEQHLTRENPDPSPVELIIQFLANAVPVREAVPPMIGGLGETKNEELAIEGKPNVVETKKTHALKLLAISVAAFLKWDLDVLEKKLPLPMQNTLLLDFIKIAFDEEEKDMTEVKNQLSLDLDGLPDEALFALHVYNRWIIRALLSESFPTKMPKIVNVQLPGQQIPSFVPQAAMEAIIKLLHETWQDSLVILEKLSTLNRNLMIPTLRTFEIPTEMKQEIQHHWDSGILVSSEELQYQLLYDLGCLHFFHEDYEKAKDVFFKAYELLPNIATSPQYCRVSWPRFNGYLKACRSIFKCKEENACPSLQEKVQHAVHNKFQGLVALLLEDNHKQELPVAYRAFLEQNIQYESAGDPDLQKLCKQVAACNIVRDVLSDTTVVSNFLPNLSTSSNGDVEMLIDVIQAALTSANIKQKKSLKNFVRFLLEHENSQILALINSTSNITQLFTQGEMNQMRKLNDVEMETAIPKRDYSDNAMLQIGELERKLLLTYNPIEIRQIIKKLYMFNNRKPLWKLNMTWELPNPVATFVLGLNSGFLQDFSYIVIAKARELARLKSYEDARNFFEIVENEVELYPKLHRAIRWESLLVDLIEVQGRTDQAESSDPELLKRCKMCIVALLQDKEFLPRPEVIEHCAAHLLTTQQWEYLTSHNNSCSSRLEFGTILATACTEIQNNNGTRKASKELWETVLPIFSGNNAQQKRSASGLQNIIQREAPHALFSRQSLIQFISKVQNVTVLSVMISCLGKLHNILKDDTNNSIYLEYAAPWPVVVSNAGAFNIKAVSECLIAVLNHTIKLFPRHIPFLKTIAELNYVLGYHTKCLKYYLEAAIIVSSYFSQPITRSIFDDQVYRRMIRCCSQLACHTQAAVLCQMMEETDYMTAFKCLQEKNCSDAMDAYYDCFWDVTILEYLVSILLRAKIERTRPCIIIDRKFFEKF